jgi:hypothetical protein
MKNKFLTAIICLALVGLTGCSPVKIYSDPGLTKTTGLKFYTVKPFLQVERDIESSRVVKAIILYLPDLSNPQYLAIKDGPGSRKVDLKLTEGTINTFGFTSDSQISESVEALAALLSKGSDAIADLSSLKDPLAIKAVSNTIELYEIVIESNGTTLREIKINK